METEKGWRFYDEDGNPMHDAMEKGRPRQFGSRSEAGRYAAQIRWGNRGGDATAGQDAAAAADAADMAELQQLVGEAQTLNNSIDPRQLGHGGNSVQDILEMTPEAWEASDGGPELVCIVNGHIIPTKRGAMIEEANQAAGNKAIAIAEARLARRGITPQTEEQKQQAKEETLRLNQERSDQLLALHFATQEGRTADVERIKTEMAVTQQKIEQTGKGDPYNDQLKAETIAVIGEVRPINGSLAVTPYAQDSLARLEGDFHAKVTAGTAVVEGVVPKAVLDRVPHLSINNNARANVYGTYSEGSRHIAMRSGLSEVQFNSTMLHEVGHAIQYNIPAARALDSLFMARRIRTGAQSPIKGLTTKYGFWKQKALLAADRDKGAGPKNPASLKSLYKDNFQRAYTGKNYRTKPSRYWGPEHQRTSDFFENTEVLTTGLQMMLGNISTEKYLDRDLLAHVAGVMLTA